MLYYLFEYFNKTLDISGTGVFQYITFRSALALMLSLLLSTIYGKRIISFLRNQQVGETVRELGLAGQNEKAGTPTMGGLIIIFATSLLSQKKRLCWPAFTSRRANMPPHRRYCYDASNRKPLCRHHCR